MNPATKGAELVIAAELTALNSAVRVMPISASFDRRAAHSRCRARPLGHPGLAKMSSIFPPAIGIESEVCVSAD
jgi:hypothetical protein